MLHKLLGLSIMVFSAAAGASPYVPSYTVLKSVVQYDVKPDGSYSEDVVEDLRVNTQGGVEDLSQYPIQYSTSLQSVKVLQAYTQAVGGKRQEVSADNMLLQQSSESANAPLFDDSKVLNVVFPALAPGVTLHVHFQRLQRVAIFPGVFALQQNYSRNEDRDSAELIIHAPASMPIQVQSLQVAGGEEPSAQPGMRTWHWRLGRNAAEVPEDNAISEVDYSPRIAVSTLGGYDALAQAYLTRARSKSEVTPAIRQLAEQITAGVSDPRQQAELLYRWVSRKVRYVAIYFGVGGVVPHAAETIAQVMYGDCKDHVTLYQALLAAKGIASSAVLVNADQSWWLSSVAVPTGAFDHAITYLPQWQLFVDTTAQFAPFGVLPDTEAGKTALVTDDGSGHSRLMTLPQSRPQNDRVRIDSQMTLSPDGSIRGGSQVAQQGIYDFLARSVFSGVSPGTEADAVAKLLQARGLQGSGSLSLSNVYDLSKPFSYHSLFELPDYVDLSGPTGLVLPSGLDSVDGLQAFVGWAGTQNTRRYPMMLDNGYCEENVTLKLPAGTQVLALPRAVDFSSPLGHYQASYQRQGDAITVHRVLELKDNAPVLEPDRYPLLRQLSRAVAHDLRAQILLQPS